MQPEIIQAKYLVHCRTQKCILVIAVFKNTAEKYSWEIDWQNTY